MSFEKHMWEKKEPITAEKLNNIEDALELAFKEIDALKAEIKNLKEEKAEEKTAKTIKTTKK